MKITCKKCNNKIEVDPAKIPPRGLNMQCPQCLAFLAVRPKASTPAASPAPSGDAIVPPPPPAAPPAGAIVPPPPPDQPGAIVPPPPPDLPAPIVPPPPLTLDLDGSDDGLAGFHDDDNQLSNDDGLFDLGGAGDGLDALNESSDGLQGFGDPQPADNTTDNVVDLDLPAPKAVDLDLPAPADGLENFDGGLGSFDDGLGGLDDGLGGFSSDDSVVDLPAPKVTGIDSSVDLPAPKLADSGVDLPAPKLADSGVDLPAPKLADSGVDLPTPKLADSGVDLPAPKLDLGGSDDGLTDLPAPKVDLGGFDNGLTDLPAPKLTDSGVDLPAPKVDSDADLPAPLGVSDLPTPLGVSDVPTPIGVTDVPAPRDVTDVPIPKDGISGLPEPAGGISDVPEPAGGISDFPEPKGGISDFPEPADGISDVPEPKGGISDVPQPFGLKGFFDDESAPEQDESLDSLDSFSDLDDFPVAPELSVDGESDIAALLADDGEGDDLLGEMGEEKDPDRVEFAPVAGAEDAALEDDEEEGEAGGDKDDGPRKKKVLLLAAGGLGLVFLAGIAVGIFTDFGLFGIHYLSGGYAQEESSRNSLKALPATLAKDTYPTYKAAAATAEKATAVLPSSEPEALALQAQAVAAMAYRFGPNKKLRAQAAALAEDFDEADEDEVPNLEVEKVRGLMLLVQNKAKKAAQTLSEVNDKWGNDPLARLYLGWAYLEAGQFKPAARSFNKALKLKAKFPGALFGMAQAKQRLSQTKAMGQYLKRTLAAQKDHTGALLMQAEMLATAGKPADAAKILQKVTRMGAGAATMERSLALCQLGDLAYAAGKTDEARKKYEQAGKVDSNNGVASIGLGRLLLEAKQYEKALKLFKRAKKSSRSRLKATLMTARTYLAVDKTRQAEKALISVRPIAGKSAVYAHLLGRVRQNMGKANDALKQYSLAIKLDPTYFTPYQDLARLHLAQKAGDKALVVLAAADKAITKSARVRNAQGEVLAATGKLDDARKAFEEALKLDATLNLAVFNLANALLGLKKADEAKARYLELRKRDSQFPGVAEKLGLLYLQTQDYDDASKAFEEALKEGTPTVALRLAAARAFSKSQQHDKSMQQAEAVLRKDSSLALARALRAEALSARGELSDALVEIQAALSREQKAEFFVILGKVHEGMGKELDAIEAYANALAKDGSLIDVQARQAILLVKNGTVKDGLKLLRGVVKANPNRADAYIAMGDALADLNEEDRALQAYRTAVAKDRTLALAHYRVGQFSFDRGKFSDCIVKLKLALKLAKKTDTWKADAQLMLGQAAMKQTLRSTAIKAFTEYLKLAPKTSPMRTEVQNMLQELGAGGGD